MLVTVAGVAPDLDGLGMTAELATRDTEKALLRWPNYHYVFAHDTLFAVACTTAAFSFSGRRWTTALLALASIHVHRFSDLIGARGRDGDQ